MAIKFRRSAGGFYLSPTALVVGDVVVGELSSFWFNSVVRGDVAPIKIGRRVNVQDQCVIHCDTDVENVIDDDVTIGHSATVHGASVGEGSLIGMGARVLGKSKIGRRCLIAAGAVVSPGMVIPDEHVVMGVPGKVVRAVRPDEFKYMAWLTSHYVELAQKYADEGFNEVI